MKESATKRLLDPLRIRLSIMEVTITYHWSILKCILTLLCILQIGNCFVAQYFENLASIIVAFAKQCFIAGAIFVAKEILSVSKNLVRYLSQKDIDTSLDAIIALQSSSSFLPQGV